MEFALFIESLEFRVVVEVLGHPCAVVCMFLGIELRPHGFGQKVCWSIFPQEKRRHSFLVESLEFGVEPRFVIAPLELGVIVPIRIFIDTNAWVWAGIPLRPVMNPCSSNHGGFAIQRVVPVDEPKGRIEEFSEYRWDPKAQSLMHCARPVVSEWALPRHELLVHSPMNINDLVTESRGVCSCMTQTNSARSDFVRRDRVSVESHVFVNA